MHEYIDNLAEADSGIFRRDVDRRRKRSSSQTGAEMKFIEKVVRDPQNIATKWGNISKDTPLENVDFDSSFKQPISNELGQLMIRANSTIDMLNVNNKGSKTDI